MAVLVADSMSLMFFRDRPHITVCNDNSSIIASTTRPSYIMSVINAKVFDGAVQLTSLSMKISTLVLACSALSISPYIATLHLESGPASTSPLIPAPGVA